MEMRDVSDLSTNDGAANQFNYDNCIVRENEDSNDSLESNFCSQLTDFEPQTSQFVELNQNGPEKLSKRPPDSEEFIESESDVDSDNVSHDTEGASIKLELQDSFILVVGFLDMVQKYLNAKTENAKRKESLKEQLTLVKSVVLSNSECFGVGKIKNINGTYIREGTQVKQNEQNNVSKKCKNQIKKNVSKRQKLSVPKNGSSKPTANSVGMSANKTSKMNGEIKIDSPKKTLSKKDLYVNEIQKMNGLKKIDIRKTPNEKGVKVIPRRSLRIQQNGNVKFNNDRLNQTQLKIKLALSDMKPKNKLVSQKRKAKSLGGKPIEKVAENNVEKRDDTLNKSVRRKLYSADTWLHSLPTSLEVPRQS